MSRYLRWLLPVVIVAAAFGLARLWRTEAGVAFRSPLGAFAPESARSIQLAWKGGGARFEGRGDAWRQVEPFEQGADAGAVRALLVAAADAAPAAGDKRDGRAGAHGLPRFNRARSRSGVHGAKSTRAPVAWQIGRAHV